MEGCLPIKRQVELDQVVLRATRTITDDAQVSQEAADVITGSPLLVEATRRAHELEAKARKAMDEAKARLEEVEKLARLKVEGAEEKAQQRLKLAEIEARQKLADLLQKAKVDAAETMADEANAAKFGRKAALSAAAIAALVLKDAQQIAQQIRAAIGDMSKLSPNQAIRLAREMVRLVESAEKSIILALQAERLRVGQPTDVVGIQTLDSSLEEREIKLKAVQRALDRAKARQIGLAVVQGGVTSAGDPTAPAPQAPSAGQA